MHAVSLFLVAIAVVLLMAPAAYHRIVYAGQVSEDMHRVGSALVTAATVPLALGLAGDVCVVIAKIAGSQLPGGGSLALVFLNRALASALEPGQLLDTQIRRLRAFQYSVDENAVLAKTATRLAPLLVRPPKSRSRGKNRWSEWNALPPAGVAARGGC